MDSLGRNWGNTFNKSQTDKVNSRYIYLSDNFCLFLFLLCNSDSFVTKCTVWKCSWGFNKTRYLELNVPLVFPIVASFPKQPNPQCQGHQPLVMDKVCNFQNPSNRKNCFYANFQLVLSGPSSRWNIISGEPISKYLIPIFSSRVEMNPERKKSQVKFIMKFMNFQWNISSYSFLQYKVSSLWGWLLWCAPGAPPPFIALYIFTKFNLQANNKDVICTAKLGYF